MFPMLHPKSVIGCEFAITHCKPFTFTYVLIEIWSEPGILSLVVGFPTSLARRLVEIMLAG